MASFSTNITSANGHLDGQYPRNLICYYSTKQNIETNETTLSWSLYAGDGTNHYVWTAISNIYLEINGVTCHHDTGHPQYHTNDFIADGSLVIPHNTDGTKTISVRLEAGFYAWAVNSRYSGSIELPRIPRQANITSAENFTDEGNPILKYSNLAGNAVDKLQATIKWNGGSLDWRNITKTASSYQFNLTSAERTKIRTAMANSNSMTVTFSLYSRIGSKDYYDNLDKTVTIINGTPILNPIAEDINPDTLALTGNKNKLILGASKVKVSSGGQVVKNSTVAEQYISCGDTVLKTNSGTFDKPTSNKFEFYIKDSRGNENARVITKDYIDYLPLTCQLETNVELVGEETATIHIKISGNYWYHNFGNKFNTIQVFYTCYKKNNPGIIVEQAVSTSVIGDKYVSQISVPNINYRDAYVVQAHVKDVLNDIYTAEQVVKAEPVFYWGKDNFNINGDLDVRGQIKVNGKPIGAGNLLEAIYPVGAIYLSTNEAEPSTLFGFGTWEKIVDKFLMGAGGSYSVNAEGGAETHTHATSGHALTVNEMPKHSHDGIYNKENGTWYYNYYTSAAANKGYDIGAMTSGNTGYVFSTGDAGGGQAHSHGDTQAASSLPPYLAVNIWRRIA